MTDTSKTYFVITIRGDLGPFTLSDIADMAKAGEIGLQDQMRTAFGRNLGTISECLANGKIPSPSTRTRIVPPRPRKPSHRASQLLAGALVGAVFIGALGFVLAQAGPTPARPDAISTNTPSTQAPIIAASHPAPSLPPIRSSTPILIKPERPLESTATVAIPPTATIPPTAAPADAIAFQEAKGTVIMEAEHATAMASREDPVSWIRESTTAGYTSTGYMACTFPKHLPPGASWQSGAELQYVIMISTPGTYRVWMRVYSPDPMQDSAFIGMDGLQLGSVFDNKGTSGWHWVMHTEPARLVTGRHTLQIRRREAGYHIDRIVISMDPGFKPDAKGPPESAQR